MATVDLFPDFSEFLELLNSAKVKYLLIGGYAVIHYGYRRSTNDLDIWIGSDSENAGRISRVLQEFGGFSARQVAPALFMQPDKVFILGRKPARIDLLTSPSGIEFDSCYKRRRALNWNGTPISVISLQDLRVNKASSGRLKDLADLEHLALPRRKKSNKKIDSSPSASKKRRKKSE